MATDTSTRTIRLDPPPPAPARMPPPAPGTGVSQRPAPVAPPPAAQPTPVRPAARPTAAPSSSAPQASQAPQAPERVGAPRRLLAGVLWGPVAIGAAMLLQMWASAQGGDQAVRPLRLLTVLLEGGGALAGGNSLLGIAVNTALGMVLGVLFALVAPRLRGPRAVLVGALVFAAGVFAVDLYALSPALSPVLELRDAPLLLASRLVFGAVLAIPFLAARRP
ncbi:hypothetical protein [Euzebya pacifica]|mgnify:CR=1 FL=1|uniref:hypothetical protein n=1 Tax=Euzebya pacifica TaxID=1608957 RepID=UPI0030F65A7D